MSMLDTEDKSHVVVVVNDIGNNNNNGSEGCSSSSDDDEEQSTSNDSVPEIVVGVPGKGRGSSSESECSVEVVDLEENVVVLDGDDDGDGDVKVHLDKVERDCRICHLSMDMTNHESGTPIELGCSCKDDLAAAHKHCAEAWFKIKGNKTCEICGSIAHNVPGSVEVQMTEQWSEANDASVVPPTGPAAPAETRSFWQGHRFLNFLLACMVFAFVISWLFHFNVPS